MTLGASGLFGTYDPENKLTYAIVGGDFSLRIQRTALRIEYLVRRQQFDTSNPDIFSTRSRLPAEISSPSTGPTSSSSNPSPKRWRVLGRVDGMYRVGNVSNVPVGSTTGRRSRARSPTSRTSFARRSGWPWRSNETSGSRDRSSSGSSATPTRSGRETELSFHLGAVGSF